MPTNPRYMPRWPLIIRTQHNVVHIPCKSRHHDQRDVHDEECKETEHGEEVDGSGRLPAAKDPRVPGKAIHHGGRHGDASKNRQGAEDKDDGEIGNLLQCVVAIKPIRFCRQMKRRVVHPRVPCLQENERRSGHNTPPLLGIEEHNDEENAGDDEAVNVDEVPNPRNTNCVPVARRADERRNIAGVVFRGPDAIAWDLSGVNRIHSLPGVQPSLKYRRG